tara:strand:+ start:114 stop:389 length:276 start_codon:yes stop_codon:yes gene_type:complete
LRESIESILAQTFSNFEFIIVDDGSTDDTLSLIRKFNDDRICLLKQDHKGLPSALNYGISKANGDLVVRMEILHYSKVSNISICLKAPQFS